MKFIIKKNTLLHNLNNVVRAVSNKNLIPILGGINFELSKKGLSLTACDNEIMINAFIDKKEITEINTEGSINVNGKYIVDIIRKLPSDSINIEVVDGSKMIVKSNASEFIINGMNSSDFPVWEIENTTNKTNIKSDDIKEIINQTLFAVSTSEARPILTGINFKFENNLLTCTATDSYRLAKYEISINDDLTANIVIPLRTLNELNKIIEANKNLEINVYASRIIIYYDNIVFQSKLLSGTYPNTNHLISETYDLIIEVNTIELFEAIDRVSLLNQDKEKNTISFSVKDNQVLLSSSSLELGRANETINITKNKETDIEIAFSSKFIMDALKTIDTPKTILKFNEPLKPIILESTNDKKGIQLILPIIIN